jgi:hypothetical protein
MSVPIPKMTIPPHRERFRKTVERLAGEVSNLLADQVALEELLGINAPPLIGVCFNALLGDRLARLIRILEEDKRNEVASFWYLLRCEPKKVGLTAHDEAHLRHLATRLKLIRDRTFFHIDKDGVLDRPAIYGAAEITGNDIIRAIEILWTILRKLYSEELSDRSLPPWLSDSRPNLKEIFTKDLTRLGLKQRD